VGAPRIFFTILSDEIKEQCMYNKCLSGDRVMLSHSRRPSLKPSRDPADPRWLHVQNLYKAFSAIRVATGRLSRIKWHRYERTLLTFRFLAVCLQGSIKFSDNEERLKVGIADL